MNALTILSEMYGAPLDLVADMYGVSMRSAYRMAQRWRAAGMVSDLGIRPVPGPTWVVPTRATAELMLDTDVRYWKPTPMMADHVSTVLRVRTALTGTELGRWTSERILRTESGPAGPGRVRSHIHDGRYLTESGNLWAVEVELTAKNLTNARAAVARAWQTARSADCAGLVYYCRGEAVKNVIRSAVTGLDFTDGPRIRMDDVDVLTARTVSVKRAPLRLVRGEGRGA